MPKIVTTDNLNTPKEPEAPAPDVAIDGSPSLSSYEASGGVDVPDNQPGRPEAESTQTETPAATISTSEYAQSENDLKRMKKYFDSQPKVTVYIPENADEHVIVNGYSFHLKRGEQVEVPVDVAEILRVSWKGRGRANEIRRIETTQF